MSNLSNLPPELLHLFTLYLETSDCSSLALSCWKIRNAVIPVLFESIRIIDEYAGDISYLFNECHHIKPIVRHVTLIQWDSDFVSATLSTDIIYHGVASFPSLTSLDLFINTAPHLCWMHRLHRIFLALRHHHIRKLQVEIADFANSNFDTMPKILRSPPIPYYCLTNLDHLRISVNSDHGIPPLWLGHFDRLILANKTTLTSLSVNMDRLSIHPSRTPFTQDHLFKILQELKQLEILEFRKLGHSARLDGYVEESLALAQPDICPALRQITWHLSHVPRVVHITRKPDSEVVASGVAPVHRPMPRQFSLFGYSEEEDLPSDSDGDDSDYEPSSSPSSSEYDYDSDSSNEGLDES